MKQTFGWALGLALAAATAACAPPATEGAATPAPQGGAATAPAAPPAAPAAGGAAVSVYQGVYTTAQATRGTQTQQRECGSCHTPTDWAQGRLLGAWNGRPAVELVNHIRATMPMDAPGRLSLQQYTDILAFILQLNEIPAGSTELPATEEGLARYTIEYRR